MQESGHAVCIMIQLYISDISFHRPVLLVFTLEMCAYSSFISQE